MRLADGRQLDQYTITDDFVHLSHNSGVYLYEDLLALLAVRPFRMQLTRRAARDCSAWKMFMGKATNLC